MQCLADFVWHTHLKTGRIGWLLAVWNVELISHTVKKLRNKKPPLPINKCTECCCVILKAALQDKWLNAVCHHPPLNSVEASLWAAKGLGTPQLGMWIYRDSSGIIPNSEFHWWTLKIQQEYNLVLIQKMLWHIIKIEGMKTISFFYVPSIFFKLLVVY